MKANSLRVGFLLSGLLHVAVVAAFTHSLNQPVPAVDEPSPISLKLSAFRLPQPAPEVQQAPEVPQQEVVVLEPEPPPPEEPLPKEPPPVEPVVEAMQEPEPPKPVVVEKPKPKPRPPAKQVTRVRPEVKEKQPPTVRPVAAVPVKIAAAEVERPQPEAPLIDVQKRQHYLAALAARINRSKYYPRASRRRGEEGTVVVSFVIRRDGELTDFVVTESSGHERLDTAALKTLRRVTPFEPIPGIIGRDQWPISVPIAFSLGG